MTAQGKAPDHRTDLSNLLEDIERLEGIFAGWEEGPRLAAHAYRTAIEALHGEALRRLVGALKRDATAASAMKQAAADETVYAVLRRHQIIKPSVAERVENALAGVRPMLASHGGDVELVKVAPPAIEVRFTGACDGCAASALTFHAGVKKAVEDACPDITQIIQVKVTRRAQGMARTSPARLPSISPATGSRRRGWTKSRKAASTPCRSMARSCCCSGRGSVVSCFQNACAHLGFPIHDGEVKDGIIACPHHGFRYDLATGECLTAPEVQLQPHAVRVIGNRVEVRLAR